MEQKIRTINQDVEIHCKRCDFQGTAHAIREYYTDCPKCDKLVYIRHLIKDE